MPEVKNDSFKAAGTATDDMKIPADINENSEEIKCDEHEIPVEINIDEEDGDDTLSETAEDNSVEKGYPFLIVIIAVVILLILSLVPWGDKTNNFLKDYNLIGDLFPPQEADSVLESTDMLDPALDEDLLALDDGAVAPRPTDSVPVVAGEILALTDNLPLGPVESRDIPDQVSKKNGIVLLEDYTPDGSGLRNLKNALARRETKPVRIAMMGDSYIEGDIITMELRDQMQKKYGGRGVGYVAAHSAVQGFRTTVRHSDSGWSHHPIKEAAGSHYFTIAGEYYTGSDGATITLHGIKKNEQLAAWNATRLLFIAPKSGKITLTVGDDVQTFDITGSPGVQNILLPVETSSVKIKSNIAGLTMLGVWLEDTNGVVVDNMSIRGDSGVSRRNTNVSLAGQMREFVDYDLIIVEFGINALSSKQTDYSKYCKIMTDVLRRLKQCYPESDFILMGIGDRGQKIHGEPHSFPTARYMVAAQRQAAKNAGVMFWDTREAMGGEDAIVRWRNDKLANGDFIHLNHAGGKRLGRTLFNSIDAHINEN